MLSTAYAQRVLGNDPSIKIRCGCVNIRDETCTAIKGRRSNENCLQGMGRYGASRYIVEGDEK